MPLIGHLYFQFQACLLQLGLDLVHRERCEQRVVEVLLHLRMVPPADLLGDARDILRSPGPPQVHHEDYRPFPGHLLQAVPVDHGVGQVMEEILGQQVNKPTLQKIEKFLEPTYKDSKGNAIDGITAWFLKNPIQARINLAYGIITGVLDGKMEKIENKARTIAIKEMQDALAGKGSLEGKSDLGENTKKGRGTLDAMMGSFNLDNF